MTQAVSSEPHGLAALDWTFADRIRKVRRDVLAIDQGEFATRLGVTRQAYAAWESGRKLYVATADRDAEAAMDRLAKKLKRGRGRGAA